MKQRLHHFLLVALLLTCLVLTVGCQPSQQSPPYEITPDEIGDAVLLHTTLQGDYLAMTDYTAIEYFADGTAEHSRPEAVYLSWRATPLSEDAPSVVDYSVEVSEHSDLADALCHVTKETSLDLYNLCIATEYYWRVTARLSDGRSVVSAIVSFSTEEDGPRNLYVEGVTNVRDLGGWKTADGNRVKQGLLYRAGRLNQSSVADPIIEITDKGITVMREELGIKTELDLRRTDNGEVGGITQSPLGEDVNYFSVPLSWDGENLLTDNIEAVKEIFEILADKDNYPILYHCNIGTDRTGLLAFLLNGLLGVAEEDLYRDYLFSNFGLIGAPRRLSGIQKSYVATVKSYPGDTLAEQIRHCLIDLGVPAANIDEFLRIMNEGSK